MKNIIILLFLCLPFALKAQNKQDTIKVVMLVSDTSIVRNVYTDMFPMQDTRPYMTYGFKTSSGTLLDAYKNPLNKNIVMWMAYPLPERQEPQRRTK